MVNRFTAVWLMLGAVAGYALAGPSLRAQSSGSLLPTAFNPGDRITLHFEYGSVSQYTDQVSCTVAEAQTRWVKCVSEDGFGRPTLAEWYSLRRVYKVTKQAK